MNTQPYPMMTPDEFVHPRLNPYSATIDDARNLLPDLDAAAQRVAVWIVAKRRKATDLERAKAALAEAEASAVFAAEIDSDGPFKGIAKTSKAYTYAIEALLAESPLIKRYRSAVQDSTTAYDDACIAYEQAETLFAAIKYKANLLVAILTASRG